MKRLKTFFARRGAVPAACYILAVAVWLVLGYLLKVVMFRFRGFGNDYAKGFHEAWVALPKLNKPKFHWKNLPNYIWVECSLIVGLFRYLIYRIQRALKVT